MESATRCCPTAAFSAPFMTKVGDGDREYEHVIVVPLAEYREICGKAALYDAMCASERGEETPPLPSEVEGATDEEPLRRP